MKYVEEWWNILDWWKFFSTECGNQKTRECLVKINLQDSVKDLKKTYHTENLHIRNHKHVAMSFSQENICFWSNPKLNQSAHRFSATERQDKSNVSNSKEKNQVLGLEFVTFIYICITIINTLDCITEYKVCMKIMLFMINLAKWIKCEWRDNIIDSFIMEDTARYIWGD